MTEKVLRNIALTFIAASIVQMFRSSAFVYCAILAAIFLQRKLHRHHITAMVSIVLGVVLVGLSYILQDNNSGESSMS